MTLINRLLAAAIFAITIAACSSEKSDILSLIPDDASQACVVDANTLFQQIDSTAWTSNNAISATLQRLKDHADLSQVTGFTKNDGNSIVILNITDRPKLIKTLTQSAVKKIEQNNDIAFKINAENESLVAVVSTDILWLTNSENPSEAISTINYIKKYSEKHPLISNKKLEAVLQAQCTVSIVVSTRSAAFESLPSLIDNPMAAIWIASAVDKLGDSYIAANVNIAKNEINADLQIISSLPITIFDALGKIDAKTLTLLPDSSNMVMAINIDSNLTSLLASSLSDNSLFGLTLHPAFRSLPSWIEAISGTIAIATNTASLTNSSADAVTLVVETKSEAKAHEIYRSLSPIIPQFLGSKSTLHLEGKHLLFSTIPPAPQGGGKALSLAGNQFGLIMPLQTQSPSTLCFTLSGGIGKLNIKGNNILSQLINYFPASITDNSDIVESDEELDFMPESELTEFVEY